MLASSLIFTLVRSAKENNRSCLKKTVITVFILLLALALFLKIRDLNSGDTHRN